MRAFLHIDLRTGPGVYLPPSCPRPAGSYLASVIGTVREWTDGKEEAHHERSVVTRRCHSCRECACRMCGYVGPRALARRNRSVSARDRARAIRKPASIARRCAGAADIRRSPLFLTVDRLSREGKVVLRYRNRAEYVMVRTGIADEWPYEMSGAPSGTRQ